MKNVLNLLESLQWLFQVQNFERSIVKIEHDDENFYLATISVDKKYQRMTINLYPIFFKSDREVQRRAIVHEFCHTITHGVSNAAESFLEGEAITKNQLQDLNEEATSQIESLIDGFLRGRFKYAKEAYKEFVKPKQKKKRKKK